MAKENTIVVSAHHPMKASLRSYTVGFALSLLLTFIPYYITVNNVLRGWDLIVALLLFAVLQLAVQLQFFIHLGHESKPRWSKLLFIFMATMLLIVVLGSLWIMSHLNYHGMGPRQTDQYIQSEEGIYR
jgi:cytochrome o ubiquinol oxidase subunit IV